MLRAETLRGAGRGVDVAYYLIHSMGRGGGGDFAASERAAAAAFARMARTEGVPRVVYLGGLGDRPESEHLRSRHETALALREHGPPLTYLRAGMVVGPQSESYRTLRYLVQRLPAMIAPAWLKNRTQPIGVDDTLRYLMLAPSIEASAGREVQIGCPDVLTYGEMLDRMAAALGRPSAPAGARAVHHPVAVVAVDRARDARRRGRRPAARRGPRGVHRCDGSLGHAAVRRRARRVRRGAQARRGRGPRARRVAGTQAAFRRRRLTAAQAAPQTPSVRPSVMRCSSPSAVRTRKTAWSASVPGRSTTWTRCSASIGVDPERAAAASRAAVSSAPGPSPCRCAWASASSRSAACSSLDEPALAGSGAPGGAGPADGRQRPDDHEEDEHDDLGGAGCEREHARDASGRPPRVSSGPRAT